MTLADLSDLERDKADPSKKESLYSSGDRLEKIRLLRKQYYDLWERLQAIAPMIKTSNQPELLSLSQVVARDIQRTFNEIKALRGRAPPETEEGRFEEGATFAAMSENRRALIRMLAHLQLSASQNREALRQRSQKDIERDLTNLQKPSSQKGAALPRHSLVTSSGMAALNTTMHAVAALSGKGQVMVGNHVYYEIEEYFDNPVSPNMEAERVAENEIDTLVDKAISGEYGALLFDPIANAFSFSEDQRKYRTRNYPAFDLQSLLERLSQHEFPSPFFLVFPANDFEFLKTIL